MTVTLLVALTLLVFGLLIGSFSNVVIWRVPRGENINFPPSHCPACDHRIGARDLVPVLSWLVLRGKCRHCRTPISGRYPLIEFASGAGYFALALLHPVLTGTPSASIWALLSQCLLLSLLLILSMIDLDTFTLPDELTLPGTAVGLLLAGLAAVGNGAGLEAGLTASLRGALLGAGTLVVIDLFGSWVRRRLRERSYPESPIGYQQIGLGLLFGLQGGAGTGVIAALLSAALNVTMESRSVRHLRVPEWLTLGVSLLVLLWLGVMKPEVFLHVLSSGVMAAGGVALLCGLYWWARAGETDDVDAPSDPQAMGFGDVKLTSMIGAFLGAAPLLVVIPVAVLSGLIFGLVALALRRGNRVTFGPFLAFGALVALFLPGSVFLQMLTALFR